MLRFILKRTEYTGEVHNHLDIYHYTLDADVPALEEALTGGRGGGPNGDAFARVDIIGCEFIKGEDSQP